MAEEKDLKLAKEAYETLCNTLDEMELKYEKDEDKLIIHFGLAGDDIPMRFIILTDVDRQLIRLMSFMPFKMDETKRVEGALITSYANYKLADGSFDYNLGDGSIIFRMTSSFRESLIGAELFKYMISCAAYSVDKYNDQFFMVSKGMLSVDDFVKAN